MQEKMDPVTKRFLEDYLCSDDCFPNEPERITNADGELVSDHSTVHYRVAVRGLLDDMPNPSSMKDYETVVYYGLKKSDRIRLAVTYPMILRESESVSTLHINYVTAEYLPIKPRLSGRSVLQTEITYNGYEDTVKFTARFYENENTQPSKIFDDLLSAVRWCMEEPTEETLTEEADGQELESL